MISDHFRINTLCTICVCYVYNIDCPVSATMPLNCIYRDLNRTQPPLNGDKMFGGWHTVESTYAVYLLICSWCTGRALVLLTRLSLSTYNTNSASGLVNQRKYHSNQPASLVGALKKAHNTHTQFTRRA